MNVNGIAGLRRDHLLVRMALISSAPSDPGSIVRSGQAKRPATSVKQAQALAKQKVSATPMTAWGEQVAPRYIRFVYSNEPVERLAGLRERLEAALAQG